MMLKAKLPGIDDPGVDWKNVRLWFVPCRHDMIDVEVPTEVAAR